MSCGLIVKKTVPRMGHEPEDERWICLISGPEHELISAAYAGPVTQGADDGLLNKPVIG